MRGVIAWLATGLTLALGALLLAFASTQYVGGVLFVLGLALPFVVWNRIGGRESWVGLLSGSLVLGVALLMAWSSHTGCPTSGAKVQFQPNKPPVACREIRASYLTFGSTFALLALAGAIWPWYRRRIGLDDDEASDGPAEFVA